MKNSKLFKSILSAVLVAILVLSMVPMTALAAVAPEEMTVVSDKESTLAPGINQHEVVVYSAAGKRVEYFVAVADLTRDDVLVESAYYNDQCEVHGISKLTEQVAAAEANHAGENYTVVAGIDASYYNMTTGQPMGAFYMNGVDGKGANPNGYTFFAVLKDGTPMIGKVGEYNTYKDNIMESVGGNTLLAYDGKNLMSKTDTTLYPRSSVGVTADGKVVFMNANGNMAPKSCGLTLWEEAQIMLEMGCVAAIRLDEGGSATYGAKPEGEDSFKLLNTPSDGGSERAISTSIIMVSTAAPSGIFDHAILTAENEYVTPESEVKVSAIGVDATGSSAEIPEGAVLKVADETYGTIVDGVFTATNKPGDAVVQLVVDGAVVGETTIHVVIPDLAFSYDSLTVPYGRHMTLPVVATTNNGANEVVVKDGDIVFALSDPKLGTIEGNEFYACDESSGITTGSVIASCKYDASKTATATLVFGKGSEILNDFETDTAEDWVVASPYMHTGTVGRMERGSVAIVDKTTGKVKNGDKALAMTIDYDGSTNAGYKGVIAWMPAVDVTGATSLGMWVYIHEEDMDNTRLLLYGRDANGPATYDPWKVERINLKANRGATLFELPEFSGASQPIAGDGWYYLTANVSGMTTLDGICVQASDSNATIWNPFDSFTFYIDDITADYSNAVDDRELPIFDNIYIAETADNRVAMAGQTITSNEIDVVATVAENTAKSNYTGLDIRSAKAYVDGVELTTGVSAAANGTITASDVALSDGAHIFRFEICDNAGNLGALERLIVVNGSDAGDVYFTKADPTATLVPSGSVQWFNLVAKNIETIDSVTTTIDLDSNSTWELEGMEVPYGFEVDYDVDEALNIATITITRTDDVEITGEAVIAEIPVRVWNTEGYLDDYFISKNRVSTNPGLVDSGYCMTPYGMWYSDGTRLLRVEAQVISGIVEYIDGDVDTFASEKLMINSEMNRYRADGYVDATGTYIKGNATTARQDKISDHIHVAGEPQSKAATCTEAGYENRIFCVDCDCGATYNTGKTEVIVCDDHVGGCASVLDWGTIIPATGHSYEFIDDVLKCECGKLYNGEYEGKLYIDGVVIADGWHGDYYYVDGAKIVDTITEIDGVYYSFTTDGVGTKYTGLFEVDGYKYYAVAGVRKTGWHMIDGTWYCFKSNFQACTGDAIYKGRLYHFNEDGSLIGGQWFEYGSGVRYYEGPNYVYSNSAYLIALKEIDGYTYGFDTNGYKLTGAYVNAVVSNGDRVLNVFDEEGHMIDVEPYTGKYVAKNGTYYLEDSVAKPAGLMLIDGDYYYFTSRCKAATGSYYVSKPNGLMDAATYDFDADGKMILKNGLVQEDDGLYYYENNTKVYAGLVEVDGDYYYFNSSKKAVTGSYYVSRTNGLKPEGRYEFGADGKMIVKNGVVVESDGTYYYEDGMKKYAGLVEFEGNYYYFNSSKKAVTGSYYVSRTNGLKPEGRYEFDADGKMIIKNGVVVEADGTYYYVDGNKTYAGLVEFEGNYYYFSSSKKAVTGSYYVSRTNGLKPEGRYEFDADGKMIIE